MKFLSLFTVAGLALTGAASPVVEKRDEAARIAAAYPIFESLYESVKVYTGSINKTCASITPLSTLEERAAAADSVRADLASITTAVDGTTPQIDALQSIPLRKRSASAAPAALAPRQGLTLDGLIANIILEISGALNNIVNSLGLGAILGALGLGPLLVSLSGLLIALRNLLDQVLELVQRLVYQLLTGLATGIIGIFP